MVGQPIGLIKVLLAARGTPIGPARPMQPFAYLSQGLDEPLGRYGGNSQTKEIPPHTPLFWSVSPNNVRLQRRANDVMAIDEEHPDAAPVRKAGTWYVLDANVNWFVSEPTGLVFPLPK